MKLASMDIQQILNQTSEEDENDEQVSHDEIDLSDQNEEETQDDYNTNLKLRYMPQEMEEINEESYESDLTSSCVSRKFQMVKSNMNSAQNSSVATSVAFEKFL